MDRASRAFTRVINLNRYPVAVLFLSGRERLHNCLGAELTRRRMQ